MEIGEQSSSPEWLEPWLQLPFYEEKCSKHEKKYNTVYCGVCMGQPVCETCWKNKSKEHEGHHQILHVRIASQRAAIDIKEISKFLDISNIQQYVINHKDIVFLNPHKEGTPNPHHNPNCEICKRRLISSEYKFCSYRFCSIACKNKSVGCDVKIEIKNSDHPEKEQPKILNRKMSSECCSLRKRSRKGIPQRAPLQ